MTGYCSVTAGTPLFSKINPAVRMVHLQMVVLLAVFVELFTSSVQQSSPKCKDPPVVRRLMADDVRAASPFYVLALPRTPHTEQIDNVCYTYFEAGNNTFSHVISVVFKNGTNTYYPFMKKDTERVGLARAIANDTDSPCVFVDYTLPPICNNTVFVLYRCFTQGKCQNADIGVTEGVDTRVVLAASPTLSPECRTETLGALHDTSTLNGGDYIILPQRRIPQCVTRIKEDVSVNAQKALGVLTVAEEDLNKSFGNERDVERVPLIPEKYRPSKPTHSSKFHLTISSKFWPSLQKGHHGLHHGHYVNYPRT